MRKLEKCGLADRIGGGFCRWLYNYVQDVFLIYYFIFTYKNLLVGETRLSSLICALSPHYKLASFFSLEKRENLKKNFFNFLTGSLYFLISHLIPVHAPCPLLSTPGSSLFVLLCFCELSFCLLYLFVLFLDSTYR